MRRIQIFFKYPFFDMMALFGPINWPASLLAWGPLHLLLITIKASAAIFAAFNLSENALIIGSRVFSALFCCRPGRA